MFHAKLPTDPIRARLCERPIRKVWTVGSGTSWYSAMVAAHTWERVLHVDAEAISSLEFVNSFPHEMLGPDVAVIGISQSGASFILVAAMRRARALGCLTLGITAEPASLLAQAAEWIVDCATGPEDALAKTKGFTTTTLGACLVAHSLAGTPAVTETFTHELTAAMETIIACSRPKVADWALRFATVSAFFVVGSGIHVPTALEGALKILEVVKMPVIGREIEEMVHGSFNAVGPETGLVLLAGEIPQIDKVQGFRKAAESISAPLMTIADQAVADRSGTKDFDLVLPALRLPDLLPLLGIVPLQLLADRMAAQRGVDGDKPRHPSLYRLLKAKAIHV